MGRPASERQFWIERWGKLVPGRLEARLGDGNYSPYLVLFVALALDAGLSWYSHLRGFPGPWAWWRWPGSLWFLIPIVLVLSIWVLRELRRRYHRAVHSVDTSDDIDPSLPLWLQLGVFLLGVVSFFAWVLPSMSGIVENSGPVAGSIKWLLLIPLVYVSIATDLVAAYLHVQVVVPWRLCERDALPAWLRVVAGIFQDTHAPGVSLDFSDSRRLGGLFPVGRTMRFAGMVAFLALTTYSALWLTVYVFELGPIPLITPRTVLAFYLLPWLLAVGALSAGLYIVHRHMAARRREAIEALNETFGHLEAADETFTGAELLPDSRHRAYVRSFVRLQHVERTSTFPFNVTVLWELFAAALFPSILQLLPLLL